MAPEYLGASRIDTTPAARALSGRYLITGGTGLLGSALATAIEREGGAVRIASRRRPVGTPLGRDWVHLDLADPKTPWPELFVGCDGVFHLSWSTIPRTADQDPVGDADINVLGTLRLLEALRGKPEVRFVFASSGGTVYGNYSNGPTNENVPLRPISAYGASKAAAETYCLYHHRAHKQDVRILRFGNPYGPGRRLNSGLGAIDTFLARALADEQIEVWGSGEAVRDYVFITDTVDALLSAMATPCHLFSGEEPVFNVGSGTGVSLNEIIIHLGNLLGRDLRVRRMERRGFDVGLNVLDIGKAKRGLGWVPRTPLLDGIARSIAASQSNVVSDHVGSSD